MDKLVGKINLPHARRTIEQSGLYVVQKKDIPRLCGVAADVCRDHPLHNWFMGGKYDEVASRLIMQIDLKTLAQDAIIYADSEQINGFAVWMPFGYGRNKVLPFLLGGGLKLIFHYGFGIVNRIFCYEKYAMGLKKEFTDEYDWCLYNISVKKDAQGKGIAGKLLRPMLAFYDDNGVSAYLETNKASSVGIYRHFGFELIREEMIPSTPVMHYSMVRGPVRENR